MISADLKVKTQQNIEMNFRKHTNKNTDPLIASGIWVSFPNKGLHFRNAYKENDFGLFPGRGRNWSYAIGYEWKFRYGKSCFKGERVYIV